ncbi:DUF820 [Desulfonema limicola]|uniref:DUF820 n=1 Tax=Desulfonema limicola TaxID=45656 RepID=A0A975B5D4_9BACT|nr:Uma2 family endonuclease [Desulfonema limicola]QTA79084.1 DUF820 [Desulfonema limicola]
MQSAVFERSSPILFRTYPVINFSNKELYDLCQINKELKIEKTSQGNLIIMSPAGGETGWRNSEIITALNNWAKKDGSGIVFDSSTGFILPDGSMRSPDAAWVRYERLAMLTQEQKQRFLPLCPDFVIELRSFSDRLDILKEKMLEYINNGARLGWLIDPQNRQIYIYQAETAPVCIDNPDIISGQPLLPGFKFNVSEIWKPCF